MHPSQAPCSSGKNTGFPVSTGLVFRNKIPCVTHHPHLRVGEPSVPGLQADKGPLETLIYVSTAADQLDMEDVVRIIRNAAKRNLRDGVCGVLLYAETRFMQCLEGSAHGVQNAYWRIVNSTAHHGIVEVFNGTVDQRRFASWEWAYRSDNQEQFSSLPTQQLLSQQYAGAVPCIERTILSAFWEDPAGARHLWATQPGHKPP